MFMSENTARYVLYWDIPQNVPRRMYVTAVGAFQDSARHTSVAK